MKTVEEVMNFVAENTFLSVWDAEDEISALDKDLKIVARGLDEDKHRWYSLATTVYKCSDGYVGVKGGYQSYSEGQDWSDINVDCEAFPMKEVTTVTYERA